MTNPWPNCANLPTSAAAALAALHLREPRTDLFAQLDDRAWRAALKYCDGSRLTLALRETSRESMPQWVRERTDENAAKNRRRLALVEETYRELARQLQSEGVEFLALKGITQCALFGFPPESRVQYDIDLFAPTEHIYHARDALERCGYEAVEALEGFPTDHLPVMIRKTGWEWRGDYFDVEIPLSVDLHFQFWNEAVERLPAPGTVEFWNRRVRRPAAGCDSCMLAPVDALGYTALHLLRHLLRGSVIPFHIYEMALLLQLLASDTRFWRQWQDVHTPELRRLEAVAFRLAAEWFGCELSGEAAELTAKLSGSTQTWFAQFAKSPATAPFHPNKDELWLHCSLMNSPRDIVSVVCRRLVPANLPPRGATIHVPREQLTWGKRAREWLQYAGYTLGRLWHHAAALLRIGGSGSRWWWLTNGFGPQFWLFLASAVVFNFALFVFVLLYNLYLSDLGFREDGLGLVNGANRAGSLVGTLPAAVIAQRFGLRTTLLASIGGTAAIELLRVLLVTPASAAVLGFVSGCVFALWAVIFAPVIIGVVDEERRPTALSSFFGVMVAVGIGGNWLGGRLPLWLHGKRPVLLLSAVLSALAIGPALKLRLQPLRREKPQEKPHPIFPSLARSRFVLRFLAAYAVWNLATGSFNPLANVYFARLHFPVERIGNVFSLAQVAQVATLFAAPLVFRRCGLTGGLGWMMLATAVGLLGLAAQPPGLTAAFVFTAYMSFQWMSEPGLNTLLLGQVREEERNGASALNYLVGFGAQALAAVAGGALVVRFGYAAVLAGAAGLAAGAGGLFRSLLPTRKPVPQSPPLPAIDGGTVPE